MTKALRIPFAARHEALKRKIASLNAQVGDEMKRPLPDWLRVRALKATRLKAKDRITALLSNLRLKTGKSHMSSLQS